MRNGDIGDENTFPADAGVIPSLNDRLDLALPFPATAGLTLRMDDAISVINNPEVFLWI